jgi:hypothetical protein
MWRRERDDLSFDEVTLRARQKGFVLTGCALAVEDGKPLRAEYRIELDSAWQTKTVRVKSFYASTSTTIYLEHDGRGNWQRNGVDDSTLRGSTDVDLAISPSTNALAINRLKLTVGAQAEIKAAWVQFPGLRIVPAAQAYTRLEERRYEYRSIQTGFRAELAVDDTGFPIQYGNIWRRVAEFDGAAADNTNDFADALISPAPAHELRQAADDFGWLIGGWAAKVRDYDSGGEVRFGEGEWWFSWVLEGRAIQDVWISPPRTKRGTQIDSNAPRMASNRYGTTVRWLDRDRQWQIVWVNPVSGTTNRLAGKRMGDRFVLEGTADGQRMRWSFNSIRPTSSLWRGEEQLPDGTWRLGSEFELTKIS